MAGFDLSAGAGLSLDAGMSVGGGLNLSAGVNVGANLSLNVGLGAGGRTDPYQACNFMVEIEGILVGGFTEVSGLQAETRPEQYEEGGQNDYVHHFAGRTSYPQLVLKHGLSAIDGLWSWYQDVVSGTFSRHNGTIYLLDKTRNPVMWWDFKDAFPVKWRGPDLRAETAAVAFESVELVHCGLSRPQLAVSIPGISVELSANLNVSGGFF